MTIKIAVHVFILSSLILLCGCRQPETYNLCECKDASGNVVFDTTYYMVYDQAYQLCNQNEGTLNYESCECSKL